MLVPDTWQTQAGGQSCLPSGRQWEIEPTSTWEGAPQDSSPGFSEGDSSQKMCEICMKFTTLTHWGWVTHICIDNLTIIGPDNGLSPGRCQAIIWTNAGILLTGTLGTNFSEILLGIQTFSFKGMHLRMSSAKWRPFCLGPNVLKEGCRLGNPETSCACPFLWYCFLCSVYRSNMAFVQIKVSLDCVSNFIWIKHLQWKNTKKNKANFKWIRQIREVTKQTW